MVYEGYRSTVLMEADFLTEIKKKKNNLEIILSFSFWFLLFGSFFASQTCPSKWSFCGFVSIKY